ncbi:oxysterol-binding protein-related protein 3-like isoform X2 [Varroa destructor]|uniref:PH domain-containing protein n=1 Tax=Varroa destructor TaxID=109461 RepID=A0A7M7KN98_VARDE|nr:oxysterol-binding protein-related protein 3-like isoform X2 [Varroa destructor]
MSIGMRVGDCVWLSFKRMRMNAVAGGSTPAPAPTTQEGSTNGICVTLSEVKSLKDTTGMIASSGSLVSGVDADESSSPSLPSAHGGVCRSFEDIMSPGDGRTTPPLSVGTGSTVTGSVGAAMLSGPGPSKAIQKKLQKAYKDDEWEVMRGLKPGETVPKERPSKHEGYIMKRRKWPLKGWHRRFFFLENGILSYAKNSSEMARGRSHGQIDLAIAFISYKSKDLRIDIDADEFIYHLKLKDHGSFDKWIESISAHRRYKQQELAKYDTASPRSSTAASTDQRVLAWVLNTPAPTSVSDRLISLSKQLANLEDSVHSFTVRPPPRKKPPRRQRRDDDANGGGPASEDGGGGSGKDVASTALQEAYQGSAGGAGSLAQAPHSPGAVLSQSQQDQLPHHLPPKEEYDHMSEMSVALPSCGSSLGGATAVIAVSDCCTHAAVMSNENTQAAQDFIDSARHLLTDLQALAGQLESQQRRASLQRVSPEADVLRSTLNAYQRQNIELKERLAKIRAIVGTTDSDPALDIVSSEEPQETTAAAVQPVTPTQVTVPISMTPASAVRRLVHESSHETSSLLSTTEFYDAAEQLSVCASSSEGSFCSEGDTEASDDGTEYNAPTRGVANGGLAGGIVDSLTTRRTKLPAVKPPNSDNGLWSLLYKNIGKDLSKVSMPVTINEPLNMLQRLCEELEYSELIDKAAETKDALERMVHIAAFAVSGYASSYYRAGHKPFNPLLGETYECIREDKGFRFIAEQVQHHPPVSACFADGGNFTFWQDIRMKTKFWGKSMEIMPVGKVHLQVADSHYVWNKVTTCVHNLFSNNQRWADQYGEMKIEDITHKITCKLTFVKASYWSDKKHEVYGSVLDGLKNPVHHLMGKWTEGIYCGPVASTARCVWRPGQMPEDYELYYGFSRFAMQLNELQPGQELILPPTDTRFRPDQRLLENGDIDGAEAMKARLEQSQRERRKIREERGEEYYPMWFRKVFDANGEENWVYNNRYWETRENPGFKNHHFSEDIWAIDR